MEALLQIGRELGTLSARMDALEAKKCGCGDTMVPDLQRSKNDFRFWIQLARLLLDLGVSELICTSITPKPFTGCCKLINKLLDAVSKGGNGEAEARELVGGCFGNG